MITVTMFVDSHLFGLLKGDFMKRIAEHSVEIQANINDIFAYMSNMEHFGEWFPGVISICSEDPFYGNLSSSLARRLENGE